MSYEISSSNYRKEIHSFEIDFLKAEHVHTYKASKQVEAYASNWCLGIANIPPGICLVRLNDEWLPLVGDVAFFIPPFSIIEFNILFEWQIRWVSIMSTSNLPFNIGDTPFLLQETIKVPVNQQETYNVIKRVVQDGVKLQQAKYSNIHAERAKKFIDKYFREDLKINDIADKLQISRVVLSRVFTANFGLTLTEYRHRLRLFEALSYLNKGYSITEALVSVGFADSSQFNLQFKKYFKTSPHKYAYFKQKENKKLLQDLSGL